MLADILSDSVKEKVTRIILAVFRVRYFRRLVRYFFIVFTTSSFILQNLIEKPEDGTVAKEHCIAMVQVKVLKQLNILEQRKFDDEDIVEDVQYLKEKLESSVQDLR